MTDPGAGPCPPGGAAVEPAADRPSWRQVPVRLFHHITADRILGMSAEAGFWGLVSLPSLLLGVFGALGYFGFLFGHATLVRVDDDVLRVARDVLTPTTVNADVAPILASILRRGHAGLLSASFVISLWSGSTAMSAYVNTVTVAYGMRGIRSAVRSRVVALGLYVLAVMAGIVLLPVSVLGPHALAALTPAAQRHRVDRVLVATYWPGLVVLSVAAVTVLYRLALPRRVPWRRHLPGALLATGIWLAGSVTLRAYGSSNLHDDVSYGTLAAPLAALLFFYVIALAVLLGAELNAVLSGAATPATGAGPGLPGDGRPAAGAVVTPTAVPPPRRRRRAARAGLHSR